MRFWLKLIAPASTGTLNVTYIESTYDGDLWVYFTKAADAATVGSIYGYDKGARGYAIENNQSKRIGTIAVPHAASVRTQAENVSGHGPSMGNTWFTGMATGNFSEALYAFTAAPHAEVMDRMTRIIKNYCAVNEPLYRWGIGEDAVEEGLIEGMALKSVPRVGVSMSNYRKLPGGRKKHDIAAVDVTWTVWTRESEQPEETEAEAAELQGQLYSMAVDSHRHWADLVHDTTVFPPSTSLHTRNAGGLDRYSKIIKVPMTCNFGPHGQWHDDPVSSLKGGHYEGVTLT